MGFKPEQFVNPVDENLHCPICHGVFQDPLSCIDGHTFCTECIYLWLETSKKCPLDNTLMGDDNLKLVRNLTVRNIVDNLYVNCVARDDENKENGEPQAKKKKQENYNGVAEDVCEWSGKLQELNKHHEVCAFYEVQCPHENCTEMVQRRRVVDHTKRCNYRTVICNNCQAQVIQRDLQHHKDVDCPDTFIPCPNNCYTNEETSKIRRSTMKDHLDNRCDNTSLACPFSDQGCSEQVLRKDMEKHVMDKMSVHMLLLAKQNKQLKQANSLLTQSNEKLVNNLTSIKKDVKTLESTLSNVKKHFKDQLSIANTYTWTIPDFPALCKKYACGSRFNSPYFWLCGYKLKLLLAPNGDAETCRSSLSIYLTLWEDYPYGIVVPSSETTITFRLTVVSQLPGINDVYEEATNSFDKKDYRSWGWPKLMTTAEALSPSPCSVADKSLQIKCTVNVKS